MVNEPSGQDFTATFSQKNSDLNKVDIPLFKIVMYIIIILLGIMSRVEINSGG